MVRMINFLTLMTLIGRAIRFFAPPIQRLVMFMVSFILTNVIAFWGGVPAMIDRIANQWLDRAIVGGFPTIWDRRLYYTLYVLAFGMVILGWVTLSYITVWLVQLIFR